MNELFKIIKFQGLKNDETKEVEGGYLFIEALVDFKMIKKTRTLYPDYLPKGTRVGKPVNGKNRKEAIRDFLGNHYFSAYSDD